MNLDFEKVFPDELSSFDGPQFVRFVASRVKAVTTTGTAPGAAFNGVAFVIVMCLFIVSTKG